MLPHRVSVSHARHLVANQSQLQVEPLRGRVQGTDTAEGGRQVITALVPTSEIQRYAVDLRSLTGGRGRFHSEHDHYDVMPANLTERMMKVKVDA